MNILESLSRPFFKTDKKQPQKNPSIKDNNANIEQDLTNLDDISGLTYGFFDAGNNFYLNNKGDFSARVTKQNELIREYRRTANIPEVANAIDEIVNEATFIVDNDTIVYLDFKDSADISDKLKDVFTKSFNDILDLIDFNYNSDSLFRQYYIDGKMILGVSFDNKNIKKGIESIKIMSPLNFIYDKTINKYRYFYEEDYSQVKDIEKNPNIFSSEEIVVVDSGIYRDNFNLSYLDVAIKTSNQLQTLEDLLIPLRFSRSISRRVFNVDVGNLNSSRAVQELKRMQNEFKYQKYYNVEKGTITNSSTIASIVEDYWFPNRGGNKGTVVDVLNETQNLGEVGDIEYFKRKLYEALKVPLGRMGGSEKGNLFDFSGTQIENDELKFFAMVNKLRQRFSNMFIELLRRQMVSKGLISDKDFNDYRKLFVIKWEKENNFLERQRIELWKARIELYNEVKDLEGDVYSRKYMLKNILKMSEEEIKQNKDEIDEENMTKSPEEPIEDEENPTNDEIEWSEEPSTEENPEEGGEESNKEYGNDFSKSMKNKPVGEE